MWATLGLLFGACPQRAAVSDATRLAYPPGQFVVRFKMEVTPKGKQRMNLDEVGLYTVQNGKIVEERFFMGGPQS